MLATRIKTGTETAHRAAETGEFVKGWIQGKIDPELYKQHLASMWHVYKAMEEELDSHATHPCVQPIYFPAELARSATLEEDMAYWWGDDWHSDPNVITMTPCTAEYVQHIHDACQADPEMLVAHSYTRYLGDISGGQILCRMMRAAFNLPPLSESTKGVKFFMFPNIDGMNKFKKTYREGMNNLPVGSVDKVVDEANRAFMFNMRIFAELEGKTVPPLAEDLKLLKTRAAIDKAAAEEKAYSHYPVSRL